MNHYDVLLSNIADKVNLCVDNSIITSSNFLDSYEQSEVLKYFSKIKDCKMILYGGNDDFERGIAVFFPSFLNIVTVEELKKYFEENDDENPITCIKLTKDKFSSLSHRDYLGALMGLGIERKMIGDIVATEDGAYIFTLIKITKFIVDNLKSVGKGTVDAEIIKNIFVSKKQNAENISATVSSLRLDNIVSLCFNLSRNKATRAINEGLVFHNSVVCLKSDKKIEEGDKVVYRSKGKIILKEIIGKSKKNRYIINFQKYS